jgi:hypothetical protein
MRPEAGGAAAVRTAIGCDASTTDARRVRGTGRAKGTRRRRRRMRTVRRIWGAVRKVAVV